MPVVTRAHTRGNWRRLIASFPREVLFNILHKLGLSLRDLAAFMAVCRDWRDAFAGSDGFLNLIWCGAKTLGEFGQLRMQPEDQVCLQDNDILLYTQSDKERGTTSICKRWLRTWPVTYIEYEEPLKVEHPKFCFAGDWCVSATVPNEVSVSKFGDQEQAVYTLSAFEGVDIPLQVLDIAMSSCGTWISVTSCTTEAGMIPEKDFGTVDNECNITFEDAYLYNVKLISNQHHCTTSRSYIAGSPQSTTMTTKFGLAEDGSPWGHQVLIHWFPQDSARSSTMHNRLVPMCVMVDYGLRSFHTTSSGEPVLDSWIESFPINLLACIDAVEILSYFAKAVTIDNLFFSDTGDRVHLIYTMSYTRNAAWLTDRKTVVFTFGNPLDDGLPAARMIRTVGIGDWNRLMDGKIWMHSIFTAGAEIAMVTTSVYSDLLSETLSYSSPMGCTSIGETIKKSDAMACPAFGSRLSCTPLHTYKNAANPHCLSTLHLDYLEHADERVYKTELAHVNPYLQDNRLKTCCIATNGRWAVMHDGASSQSSYVVPLQDSTESHELVKLQ